MKLILALCGAAGLLLPAWGYGQTGTRAAASTCDAVAQTGCGPGEKCAVILDDSGTQRIACAPDGTVPVGGRCGSFAGVDDCVGGTACVNGTCRQACDPAEPGSCPSPQACTVAGDTGVGTCATRTSTASSPGVAASTCDVVAQTGCGPGEKCAVILDDSGTQRIACAPDGTVPVGGRCGSFAGVDDCVSGTACVDGSCRQACDPAQPGSCPTPQTCTAVGAAGVGSCVTLTSTADSPDTAASTCDAVAQTGCGPGEKCAVVLDDSGGQRIACAPNGTVPLSGRCGSFAGVDDCVAGMACVGGVCRQACDPAEPGSCPSPQTCTVAGDTGVGTCATLTSTASSPDLAASTCDIVAQTGCRPGEKCALVSEGAGGERTTCAPDGTVGLGGRCTAQGDLDDCVAGLSCVDGTCQRFCDPAQPFSCPTGQTCDAPDSGGSVCRTSTSTAAAPPPTSSGAACGQHQDCRPGTYCAADGTCHPDSHRPRSVTASPSLRNFRSGRVCTGPDGTQTVCQEAVDMVIDGRDQCEFNHEKVRCNWFGWEFDFENFDPSIPIRCAWVRSMPADEGNRDGIRQENATRGTSEFWLPGACGHFISPGFQNHAIPRDRRRVVVNARFDCSYDGKPLFDVQYRFHFGP